MVFNSFATRGSGCLKHWPKPHSNNVSSSSMTRMLTMQVDPRHMLNGCSLGQSSHDISMTAPLLRSRPKIHPPYASRTLITGARYRSGLNTYGPEAGGRSVIGVPASHYHDLDCFVDGFAPVFMQEERVAVPDLFQPLD